MRFDDTDDLIDAHTYPATSAELIAAYGDSEIELQNGTETLGTVLGRLGPETYHGPQDVRDALFTGVGHEAIGRRYYSDRDAYALGESGPEQVSF
ncbi:DUF2795 domain-containing protein [Halobium salinum]|uniref:DUF2795 domain-containing protein n=1 Tax=Halobium salinum TaxID=1364940 RepID=A0ABD5PFJ1_9EURY|nr:DUF2795 domain-containing protein [Halobium salinum]